MLPCLLTMLVLLGMGGEWVWRGADGWRQRAGRGGDGTAGTHGAGDGDGGYRRCLTVKTEDGDSYQVVVTAEYPRDEAAAAGEAQPIFMLGMGWARWG